MGPEARISYSFILTLPLCGHSQVTSPGCALSVPSANGKVHTDLSPWGTWGVMSVQHFKWAKSCVCTEYCPEIGHSMNSRGSCKVLGTMKSKCLGVTAMLQGDKYVRPHL